MSTELIALIALIIIGIIIILLIKLIFMLIPAALIAIAVYMLTHNTWLAGLAFLIVAALSILKSL